MVERINLLICSDINYAPYYGVMLTSLFMNNKSDCFDVYLLTDNSWTKSETHRYERLCRKYDSKFYVQVVDDNKMQVCPLNPENHIARSTYYRLMAAEILPNMVEKIIYLDGDMVVCRDIRELWEVDMTGFAVAGVIDSLQFVDETYSRLGFEKKYGYFNAGVELINLKYWRDYHVSELAMDYITNHQENIPFMDQDVINAILAEKKTFLPIRFNYQTMFLTKFFSQNFTSGFFNEVLVNSSKPVIIHYNGGIKPWHWRYFGLPYKKEWDNAYKASPWRCARIHQPWSKYIKHLVKRLFINNRYRKSCQKGYIHEIVTKC